MCPQASQGQLKFTSSRIEIYFEVRFTSITQVGKRLCSEVETTVKVKRAIEKENDKHFRCLVFAFLEVKQQTYAENRHCNYGNYD
jgi:hypothetical protein